MKPMIRMSLIACLVSTFSAQAALTIHQPTSTPNTTPDVAPSNSIVVQGKGRHQPLDKVLQQISHNQALFDVRFVVDSLRMVPINWQSEKEPVEYLLARIARQYPIDFLWTPSQPTLTVDVASGTCTAAREAFLIDLNRQWKNIGVEGTPVLPNLITMPFDLAGYTKRLC